MSSRGELVVEVSINKCPQQFENSDEGHHLIHNVDVIKQFSSDRATIVQSKRTYMIFNKMNCIILQVLNKKSQLSSECKRESKRITE